MANKGQIYDIVEHQQAVGFCKQSLEGLIEFCPILASGVRQLTQKTKHFGKTCLNGARLCER